AVAVNAPDRLAVGARRWRRKVALVVETQAHARLLLPTRLAAAAPQAERLERPGFLIHGTDKHTVVPDDRSGRRGPGQVRHPFHVFGFREAGRQSFLRGRAVE